MNTIVFLFFTIDYDYKEIKRHIDSEEKTEKKGSNLAAFYDKSKDICVKSETPGKPKKDESNKIEILENTKQGKPINDTSLEKLEAKVETKKEKKTSSCCNCVTL